MKQNKTLIDLILGNAAFTRILALFVYKITKEKK